MKQARATGAWDPVLDTVSDRRLGFAVEAQDLFNKTLAAVAPKLATASACPHRNVESYPPVSLANVQEVDLQAQWEQTRPIPPIVIITAAQNTPKLPPKHIHQVIIKPFHVRDLLNAVRDVIT